MAFFTLPKIFKSTQVMEKRQEYSKLMTTNSENSDLESGTYCESPPPSPTSSNDWQEKQSRKGLQTSQCRQFINARVISDATIGLSDGLTVPFALTAGLSAFGKSNVVIYGGMAELLAGCISMGLGGYLGAKSEGESFNNLQRSTIEAVQQNPEETANSIREACSDLEMPPEYLNIVVQHIQADEDRAIRFLTKHACGDSENASDSWRAYTSAITIAGGYFSGGFIPLLPYFFIARVQEALLVSIAIMAVALFLFGYFKTRLVGQESVRKCVISAVQTMALGGCAAAVAVGCVKLGSWWEGAEGG